MQITKKKFAVVGSAVAVLALSGTGAMAYWTTGGSGTGSAAAGDTVAIVINQTSSIVGLFPGDSQALSGNFDNDNAHSVQIAGITAAVTGVTEDGGASGPNPCTTADFEITGTSGVNTVPAGTGVGSWSGLSVGMINKPGTGVANNQDRCKNATLQITYSVA